ncbi:MAG: hypothetical protein KatS3mg110_2592 [Pirellulaceae bacterium]|nr:MAG: hypothetical protein KatS3mg110_2592 [Pirellulaceae bacterium]
MESDWDFYFCELNGRPASILLDLAYGETGPVAGLNECLIMRLTLREVREDGLPTRAENERLAELEDALEQAWEAGADDVCHVGRVTTNGWRDFFFYCREPQAFYEKLTEALARFSDYQPEFGLEDDPEWQIYFGLLYPSDREWQMISSERLLRYLEESGDQPEIERDVVHWVAFDSEEARTGFVQKVSRLGFQTRSVPEDETDMPFAVEVSRRQAADRNSIHETVFLLYDLSQEFGGKYDGWETSVERGDAA